MNAAYRAPMDGVATNLTYANVRETGAEKTVPCLLDCALTAAPLEGHARTGQIHASVNQVGVCVFMVFQRIRRDCLKGKSRKFLGLTMRSRKSATAAPFFNSLGCQPQCEGRGCS